MPLIPTVMIKSPCCDYPNKVISPRGQSEYKCEMICFQCGNLFDYTTKDIIPNTDSQVNFEGLDNDTLSQFHPKQEK